jgi:ribonuclease PH
LRSVFDLEKLEPRTMWIDCDVLQADGGTRTAAITGASLAVTLACQKLLEEKKITSAPMLKLIGAVSAGIVEGSAMVDLNYEEDKGATVDFNLVATESGEFVEIQGSGEEATFTQAQLDEMLALGRRAIAQLILAQRNILGHPEWSEAESKGSRGSYLKSFAAGSLGPSRTGGDARNEGKLT